MPVYFTIQRPRRQRQPGIWDRDQHPYAIFVWSANSYQESDPILPNGKRIHYVRISAGSSYDDAVSGTFSTSENAITRDRLANLTLVIPAGRVRLEYDRWSEQEPESAVRVTTTHTGT